MGCARLYGILSGQEAVSLITRGTVGYSEIFSMYLLLGSLEGISQRSSPKVNSAETHGDSGVQGKDKQEDELFTVLLRGACPPSISTSPQCSAPLSSCQAAFQCHKGAGCR